MENLHSFIIKQLDKVFNPDAFNGRNKNGGSLSERQLQQKKEWQELWRRINTRTYYMSFETSKLIKSAIDALDKHLNVTEIRIVVESGSMEDIRNRELEAGAAMSAAKIKDHPCNPRL